LHIEFYPDPDHDALELYNASTSTFAIRDNKLTKKELSIQFSARKSCQMVATLQITAAYFRPAA
jgi:hypothetical protein